MLTSTDTLFVTLLLLAEWLPVLANIAPPDLRCKASTDRLLSNIKAHPNWPGFNDVFNHPPARLASRSPIWSSDMTPVDINAQWSLDVGSCGQPVFGS